MKHKILGLAVLAALTVTLVGCGHNSSENASAPETAPVNPPPATAPSTHTNAAATTNAP